MKRLAAVSAGAALALALIGIAAFVSLGRWFHLSQPPRKADALVILGGDPSRALKAADLYREGWAPEIWVSRTRREAYFSRLAKVGVDLPPEEALIKNALVRRGVPAGKVRFYGKEVLSTLEEAASLRRELGREDAKLLVVTSPTHARRARLLFRRAFPKGEIVAVSTEEPAYDPRWWKRKFLAEQVIKEALATAYTLLGGKALNHRP